MTANQPCPVKRSIDLLNATHAARTVLDPELRRHMDGLRQLLEDIASGHAGDQHLAAMDTLAGRLAAADKAAAAALGRTVLDTLSHEREDFQSHIESQNCPTGDCDHLTPAPCQMACPAGIDVAGTLA
jgi:hypothetical protein